MKRFKLILATVVCLLLVAPLSAVAAKDNWTSVRSKNFFLVGNASDKQIRKVAIRLEQFREVLARLLKAKLDSPIPIKVVVFKSRDAYKQFGPPGTAGYFQPAPDVNYIALDAELKGEYPFDTIFHEYVHFIVKNNVQNIPVWFNEGLAEFYSTFSVAEDDKKVTLGSPISNHVLYLRQQKLIPLQTLFTVNRKSPLYNETNKRGVFYAESWALVHYLLHGEDGKNFPQLGQFLNKTMSGMPVETAFQQAFQRDFKSIEKALKEYIQRDRYPAKIIELTERVGSEMEMQSAPLTEAEGQFYLGDLLLHARQLDKAEPYLQKAVALEPNLALAQASLGMLNMYRGRFAEAKQYLQRAVAGNSPNYLVHYYYAYVLSREGMDEGGMVRVYEPETVNLMRAELKKVIELAPEYAEAYHLLAFINLITGEQLDESIALLRRAMSLEPREQKFGYVMAQIYMRQRNFRAARETLERIARNNAEPELQAQAQAMLKRVSDMEEQMTRFKASTSSTTSEGKEDGPSLRRRETSEGEPEGNQTGRRVISGTDMQSAITSALGTPREGEQRLRGLLLKIDCSSKGVAFVVKVGDRTLRLQPAPGAAGVVFMSFTPEVTGGVSCGERNPVNEVVITYRPGDGKGKTDGEVVGVAFVPKDFVLK